MEIPITDQNYCATCGKNLRVVRQRFIMSSGDRRYCSKHCLEKQTEPPKRYKISRLLGGGEICASRLNDS